MSVPYKETDTQAEVAHVERAPAPAAASKASDGRDQVLEHDIAAFEERKLDFRTAMAIVAALLSYVLPVAILFTIDADIGPSGQINWIATAWSLATAVVQTIAGRCSDIFGRRNFTIAGNLFGLIAGILHGLTMDYSRATSVNTVIAGTALMGIGSGPQQLSFACANEIVPKKSRGQTLAFLNLAALPGSAFGSVIAYALVANLSWRWAFYVGIIANGFALILITIFYWPPGFVGLHPEGKSRLQQFKELDFLGLILFGGGLTSFLLGLSFGNNPYPWSSARVLVPLLIGAATFLIAFPIWEVYSPDTITKLCPPAVFKNVRGFTLPLCVIFVSGMLLISLQVLWPQEVQLLFTTVPTTVGWYSLSYNAASTLGALVSGVLFARIRRTRWQFLVVTILQTIFIASMASVDQHTPRRAIGLVIVAAFSVGASQIIGLLIIQFGAKDCQIGVATGATGGAIAIAIYGSIIQDKVSQDLAPGVAAAAIEAGLAPSAVVSFIEALTSRSAAALGAVEGITPAIIAAGAKAVQTVYADAFRLVYLVSLAFGGISIIAAIFVRSVDDALTSQVAVKLGAPHLLPGHGTGDAGVISKEIDEVN
ncbi:hypothetical protein W97_05098 [Coniosporium apollinis CBS 100218]|uniref:Major facilitator superfamily (MFS) profile domain-containing protein n=1 Tax=Coniosporium apollinis (strain CBS 100218) TaxID=1168221 RepID=R7YW01_CONA1|nr:uncharacterized protein W97_05098 [Coniosporium apollinis CBS 100218]EON65856.1 hypothetical protein W97_05098 [Coniosporium apollinis CBS 100218]